MKGKVVIFMGSKVDSPHVARIEEWLDRFGLEHEARIASAHKTPRRLLEILNDLESREGQYVYIAVAGLSNALSGMLDFATSRPVISCPPICETYGGADIWSSIRMPPGVAPGFVLDPKNAALFAAKILGLSERGLADKVKAFQAEQAAKIESDEAAL